MASGAHSLQQSKLAIEGRVKTLINNDLKEICRGENLAVSGVKAQLQARILSRMCDHPAHALTPLSVSLRSYHR